MYDHEVAPTLTSSGATVYYEEARNLNNTEYIRMSSFPSDFDFCGTSVRYVCGMSVPPLMIAGIADEIQKQRFPKDSNQQIATSKKMKKKTKYRNNNQETI